MCYNCKVVDKLELPKGYLKRYIEWYIPQDGETLQDYARLMSRAIDTSQPFDLVGYSFGAVVMQEMNRFLKPGKNIVISSFKSPDEIPALFHAVRKAQLVGKVPKRIFDSTDFITSAFNRLVYNADNDELSLYMTQTSPRYIKWAVQQITDWIPDIKCEHLYHIHGTEDQIFPFEKLHDVIPVEGGDHLMVIKKSETVRSIISSILLYQEETRP